MLSRKAKYGLIACLHLARHYDKGPCLIGDIAEKERLPRKFIELILLELKNAGLLDSKKGRGGGYTLAKPPADISVADIVRTLDGPLAPIRCASATAPVPCEDCVNPDRCGIRDVMREARDAIAAVLEEISLEEVNRREEILRGLDKSDPMYYI